MGQDEKDEKREERAKVNPAARRDRAGEPHEELDESGPHPAGRRVRPYQKEPLDPRDQGGIAE